MKEISITDITLRCAAAEGALGFKERIEVAKCLDRLLVSTIELPPLGDSKADVIFVKTLASVITNAALALPAGLTAQSVRRAWEAVQKAAHPRLIVDAPVSSVQMEYLARQKPPMMLETIAEQVRACAQVCGDVEFCATDASRAELDFLVSAIEAALGAGARRVTLCDTAGVFLPEEFGRFVQALRERIPALCEVPVSVLCSNAMELGAAAAVCAMNEGAAGVKVCLMGAAAPQLRTVCAILTHKGLELGLHTHVKVTELERTLQRIRRLTGAEAHDAAPAALRTDDSVTYDSNDTMAAVAEGVSALGYELSDEDLARVYEEFQRLAAKKPVSRRELDAIVAASAMQVPAAYTLGSYVINSGSIITATACLHLTREGQAMEIISTGDGPIDAAFKAMESVTGRHFELEDFRIDAVTEGKEAIGRAIVRLRSEGRLYSGSGVSTDIVGASIRAYLGALNKIVYEEKEA